MARPLKRLQAEPAVVEELRRRSRARTSMVRERERAEIILLRLEGLGVAEIALRLKTTAKRVSTWSKRFETRGLAGLEEAAGRGRKPSIPTKKVDRVVTEVTRPPKGRKRWSVRSMGRHAGVSHSTVQRKRFFADLTEDVIRSGSFASVKELVDDINAYLTERNANPQPYKWTAKGEAILEKSAAPARLWTKSRLHELLVAN